MIPNRAMTWITAEIGEGAQEVECRAGPGALRERLQHRASGEQRRLFGLHAFDALTSDCANWRSVPAAHALPGESKLTVVADFMPRLAATTHEAALRRAFPVVIGGDHSCAVGTWSGIAQAWREQGRIGLIWIDAHLDSHTPATSDSQAPHGMPLAALLGHGDERLTHLYGWCGKLRAENVVVVGARSYEAGEAALLKRLGVRIIGIDEVRSRGMAACMAEAIGIASQGTLGYGVTFDVDALDPLDAPGVGSPVENGIRLADALHGLDQIAHDARLIGFELVEYNPSLDDAALTTAAACEALLTAVLAERAHTGAAYAPAACARVRSA